MLGRASFRFTETQSNYAAMPHSRLNQWSEIVAKTRLRRHFEFGNVYFFAMNFSSYCSFSMNTGGSRLVAGAEGD